MSDATVPAAAASAVLAGLAASAVLVRAPTRSLARLVRGAGGSKGVDAGRRARRACLLLAISLVLVLGPVVGGLAGVAVLAIGPRLLAGLVPAAEVAARRRLIADLPLALDLLAACLAGGAGLSAAVKAVAEVMPGPCGARLSRVAGELALGSPPAQAWAALAAPGGEQAHRGQRDADPLAAAARTLARAADSGAPIAAAVARLAATQRAEAQAHAVRGARRAGVLAVAPLGLCFLPAFVLIGVVPIVAGLVGPLLSGLSAPALGR